MTALFATLPDGHHLAVVTAIFVLAGLVKGAIGLGLPLVAIGLLSLVMLPAEAATLLVVPALVTNVWQALAGPALRVLLRRFWGMLACLGLGVWLAGATGAAVLTADAAGHAATALGLILLVYAALGLAAPRFRITPSREPWLSPLIGGLTGVATAATGVFSVPSAPYLTALGLDKDALVQALGLTFTVATLSLSASLIAAGVVTSGLGIASVLALLPSIAGVTLGQWLRARISQPRFRQVFLIGLLVLGAHLASRGLV